MASPLRSAMQIAANVLIPIAILVYASGFFPYKPFLPGLAEYESLHYDSVPEAPFNKVIFMVVDALRSDFVYSNHSGFQYTQSLISNGAAFPFTAHASSPTITMPRIKAITTGSIPSFLDVILNFAESDTSSTLAAQDTWLAQMKAKDSGKMIMYGDDTWLKLFPDTFDRADGTSSFFVSDFTEVDTNVTRHVPNELAKQDWNTMVLHYLGLDHIGHKAGPRSPNMIPKQQEMDGLVQQLYEAIKTEPHLQSTLLVLCGDHGMNDVGNHGGSSPGETSPALVFMSPKLEGKGPELHVPAPYQEDFQYYETVEQSDIVPTLGALLDFPVPRNNLGTFITRFGTLWPDITDSEQILLRNARQILNIVTATFPTFEASGPTSNCETATSRIDKISCKWRSIVHGMEKDEKYSTMYGEWIADKPAESPTRGSPVEDDRNDWQHETKEWMIEAQDLMSSTASNYNMTKLVVGQILALLSLLFSLVSMGPILAESFMTSIPFMFVTIAYGFMMFASSYVEEEQQFWYWVTSAWFILLTAKGIRKQPLSLQNSLLLVVILALTRLARRWNQTGQKFAGEPDIARTFLVKHRLLLWGLIFTTYLSVFHALVTHGFQQLSKTGRNITAMVLIAFALTFKIAFTHEDSPELLAGVAKVLADNLTAASLLWRARIVFILLTTALLYTIYTHFTYRYTRPSTPATIHTLLVLFLLTQTRTPSIPLHLLSTLQLLALQRLPLTPLEISTTTLVLHYTTFFTFGGSNAISSIDLSSAYNGVSSYSPIAVGLLTFLGNWAGCVFWCSGAVQLLLQARQRLLLSEANASQSNTSEKGGEMQEEESSEVVNKSEQGSGEYNIWQNHISLLTLFTTSSISFTMLACTMLRSHLFIWTVFSPKYLYLIAWSLGGHLCVNIGLGGVLYSLGST